MYLVKNFFKKIKKKVKNINNDVTYIFQFNID